MSLPVNSIFIIIHLTKMYCEPFMTHQCSINVLEDINKQNMEGSLSL